MSTSLINYSFLLLFVVDFERSDSSSETEEEDSGKRRKRGTKRRKSDGSNSSASSFSAFKPVHKKGTPEDYSQRIPKVEEKGTIPSSHNNNKSKVSEREKRRPTRYLDDLVYDSSEDDQDVEDIDGVKFIGEKENPSYHHPSSRLSYSGEDSEEEGEDQLDDDKQNSLDGVAKGGK
jgi:hypothetical protein